MLGVPVIGVLQLPETIRSFFKTLDEIYRGKATDILEWEAEELENIFALLVLGVFVGIPSPPIHITLELWPEMEREFNIMLEKVSTAHDPLVDLFSVLNID